MANPPTKTIAVLGATGTQGSSVIKTLLSLPTTHSPRWQIRAITRNPNSSAAQAIRALSPDRITLIQADTSQPSTLVSAFQGCHAIFAVTDYWAPFNNAALRKQHATGPNPGQALRQWAYDDEVQHGMNIAWAANEILEEQDSHLEHFIWSSLPSCRRSSGGKYTGIYHYDSKAHVRERIEAELPKLAERMSIVYVGFYVSNIGKSAVMTPKPDPEREGAFVVYRLCSGDVKHPFIITEEDTGVLVSKLLEREPGVTVLGYTAMVSWGQITEMWGRVTGREVRFEELSLEEFKKLFPVEGEELLSAKWSEEFGWKDRDDVLVPEDLDVDVSAGEQRVERWLRHWDWSEVLKRE